MWVVSATSGGWFGQKIQHLLLIEIESLAATGFARERERQLF
jgi:hypothetical protein